MRTFNVHEAKTQFSAILALVASGEDVVVAKAGHPVAVITAYRNPAPGREPGHFRDKIVIHDTFFEPMDDEFMKFFE
jgi:prevent-host-death family protein